MPVSSSRLVRKANQASSSQLFEACGELETRFARVVLTSLSFFADEFSRHAFRTLLASELHTTDRDDLWMILKENMRELYTASSFGWNPSDKRVELFSSLSRFVLIDIDDKLAGFAMFRFECEEKEDIIYCYELQIRETYQRSGLGKFLMQALEAIGRTWHMKKIVLTVFDSNIAAYKFYQVSGFSMDETSPGYSAGDNDSDSDVDYFILSKQIHE